MIFLIILGVAVLLFAFMAYMVSKNWRWTHVTLLVFIFFGAIGSMILGAAVLKTQAGWRAEHDKLSKEMDKTEKRLAELQVANALSDDPESVPRLQGELNRLIIDRGRVWRNAIPAPGDGVIDLNMARWGDTPCAMAGGEEDEFEEPEPIAVEDGEAAEGADAVTQSARNPHQITQGMIVHAFLEVPVSQLDEVQRNALFERHNLPELDTKNACRVPGAFLGSFQVVGAGDTGITVKPMDALTETQASLLGNSTWALYEVMPRDSHRTLNGLSSEAIQSLFAFAIRVSQADEITQAEVEQSIDEFIRDGQPADSADPQERRLIRVKFTQDHTVEVDVEEAEQGIDQRQFDFRGRAQSAELQNGAPIEFKAGDVNYFDAVTATRLRDAGVAEFDQEEGSVWETYSRELRDYTYLFTEYNARLRELGREMGVLQDQLRSIVDASDNAKEQIAYRQQELVKLDQDLVHFKEELAAISKLKSDLAAYRTTQLQTLSYLYHANLQLRGAF